MTELEEPIDPAKTDLGEGLLTEACPVCKTDYTHVSKAPLSIDQVDEKACITTFNLVFFHGEANE